MKARFTPFRRGQVFYCQDTTTGQQTSLRIKDAAEAQALLHSQNEAPRQPAPNPQIARSYLTAACLLIFAAGVWWRLPRMGIKLVGGSRHQAR